MNKGKVLINDKWLKVIREDVIFPNNVTLKNFLTVERPDYSAVIPLLDRNRLILVEQYRHGPESLVLNLPMGVIPAGEEPIKTAQRELIEETGYYSQKLSPIGVFANAPSFLRLQGYLFLGEQLIRKKMSTPDPQEETRVVTLSLQEAADKITKGEITDMTTVIGIYYALLRSNNGS